MDIQITDNKKWPVRRWALAVLAAGLAIYLIRLVYFYSLAEVGINSDEVSISIVEQGEFRVLVRGVGELVPDQIRWVVSPVDQAKVEQVLVKPGDRVKAGELLIRLSNPWLRRELAEASWELEALSAELDAQKARWESERLAQDAQVLDFQLRYESNLLEHRAQKRLLEQASGSVSRLQHEKTALDTVQWKKRWEIGQAQVLKLDASILAQEAAMKARWLMAQRRVESLQKDVDDLDVKASIDSIVLEAPVEAGARLQMGSRIAKLVEEGSMIAELKVPELRIHQIQLGQEAKVISQSADAQGYISRVDPSVVNGQVTVDISFPHGLPVDARPEMTVRGEILVGQIDDTFYVRKPVFAHAEDDNWVYVLSDDRRLANRTKVKFGMASVSEIEVLSGLVPGDQILTSDLSHLELRDNYRIDY